MGGRNGTGKMISADRPGQRRNANTTRQAILDSALIAFTRSGYDGVGVREIAQGAGVTAMLVNRYFGSKEQLFAEAAETAFAGKGILTEELTMLNPDRATLARDVAAALVARTSPAGETLSGFLLMLR